ncbi:hypothetical protein [Arthrobacter sp. Helios]|uniref:hypothetical protein n=1 Tax=Arthrobacter sp. Helios TaxID=2828862 RepID=UPI002069B1BE|nr:hypothetical protein [Arthrobacter sp. Helios]UPO78170.1 hypothetical protein ArtHe_05655 [Arthrobacter sp. Helios]
MPAQGQAGRTRAEERYSTAEKVLIGLELGTGAAALGSGLLLVLRPDGAFLHADPAVLRRTPFADWRVPGLLLATGCGGGYLLAGLLQLRRHRAARAVSVAAGASLVALEIWETAVVEFQPLEAVFAGVGGAVVALALRGPAPQKGLPSRG